MSLDKPVVMPGPIYDAHQSRSMRKGSVVNLMSVSDRYTQIQKLGLVGRRASSMYQLITCQVASFPRSSPIISESDTKI